MRLHVLRCSRWGCTSCFLTLTSRSCLHKSSYRAYSLLKKNALFFVVTINLYVLTFAVILPMICGEWAYSKYFNSSDKSELENKAIAANNERLQKAEKYLSKLNASKTLLMYKTLLQQDRQEIVDLAIGVVTVRRNHPTHKLGYLTQVVTQLDKHIRKDTKFPTKVLIICDTFAGPGTYEEASMLGNYYPVYERFPGGNATATVMDKFEKEKQDYSFCLRNALRYKPRHILIVEDDAFPREEMFDVLHFTLTGHIESKKYRSEDDNHKWSYLKLFYPEKWQGYAFETPRILELVTIAGIGGCLFLLLYIKCCYGDSTQVEKVTVFALGATYFVLFSVLLGRQYVIEWRRVTKYTYSVIPAPDCCSPAMLYTADMARQIANYFDQIKCNSKFPIDFAMDKFASEGNYNKYLVEPNLMRHIGMFSSLKTKNKSPQEFIF